MAAQEQLTALIAVYEDYLVSYQQRAPKSGVFHGLRRLFRGGSTAEERKADMDFYHSVQRAVAELSAALTEEDGAIAARAVRYMILETEGSDASSRLMIEAIQAVAIPLLAFVPQEERAAILAGYQGRYPKKRLLSPKQRELLAALENG